MAEQGSMTGKVFGGRYQINDRIGIGGMAEVYRAQDNVLGRTVAVKVMLPQYAADADFTRRFRQEAAAAANLQSPYIVNVYDWGQEGDTYYIVMEFVRGGDLKTAIQQRGAINQRKVAEIGSQVCQALTVAHKQDIIHRDIKPQNIMVQPDGNVKVMDFGIARAKNSLSGQTSAVLGTAHYISPEQAQGKELTPASDIYSLGVVLYEAATGKLPFDGPDAVSVALKQVKEYPTPPREINPGIDPALEDIIMTAMEKDPNDRFATANDMRLALNDYLTGRTAATRDSLTSAQTRVIGTAGAVAAAGAAGVAGTAAGATTVMPTVKNQAAGAAGETQTVAYSSGDVSNGETKKSHRGLIIGIIIAAVVVVAIVAIAAWAFFSNADITVPDVVGKTQAEATTIIEDAGLEVGDVTQSYSDSVAEGLVISQNPRADTQADKDAKISLVISQGAQTYTVPDVVGKSQTAAEQEIRAAGLKVGEETQEYSDTVAEGIVIRQDPASDTVVEKDSPVSLVVSQGAEPVRMVEVPNVLGYGLDYARSSLQEAGLNVYVTYDYSDEVGEGRVISQSYASGSSVAEGTTVTLEVSNGPDPSRNMTTVPNVVGLSEAAAERSIDNAGLYYDDRHEYSDVDAGYVIRQSPSGDSSVSIGSTIIIYISDGPAVQETQPDDTEPYQGGGGDTEPDQSGGGDTDTGDTDTDTDTDTDEEIY